MSTDTQREAGCVIGGDYPESIVDGKTAWTEARREVDESDERHGSHR
ncbi:MAG: hypothetical protein ABEK29_02360 [Bradymonadaceae bacterium]